MSCRLAVPPRSLRLRTCLLAAAVGLAAPAAALASQQMAAGADTSLTPAGWAWRSDAPATPQKGGTGNVGATKFEFTQMAPGWHITMGPGALLYPQGKEASGRFVLAGEMIYFPDGADSAAYGIFVGGRGLDAANPTWTMFVLRADGSGAVMQRGPSGEQVLRAWSRHEAINARDANGWARNTVAVRAEPDSVRFVVNGQVVHAWRRDDLAVEGQYGFRIGKGANLHITNLDLTQRLAPYPARR